MERTELEKIIIELVSISFNRGIEEISLETSFEVDLGGASIQMVGLIAEIENELDVLIQLKVASTCKTIKELVDKVEELI